MGICGDKIITLDYLKGNKIVHVKINDMFKQNLKNRILDEYGSLTNYNKEKLNICLQTFVKEFRTNKYFKFDRLLKISRDFNIPDERLYSEISVLFARGSNTSKELILPKELHIDEFFVECYALYLAEGNNGSNGKTIPRRVRFANSELTVHKHFIKWLRTYFPNNYFYFNILVPHNKIFTEERRGYIKKFLNLEEDQIKMRSCVWKRKTGVIYMTNLDSALLIDFILSIKNKIKELCAKDMKLAPAYVRGMMIGEGTAYFNRSRYVRIEMKNEEEIKYLHKLLTMLGFNCKPSLRKERENMWSLFIGAKQLKRFNDLIGFGVHDKRQRILEKGVNKVLKVNQYC